MAWSKPRIKTVPMPIRPNRGRWGGLFVGLSMVIGLVLALLWPDNQYLNQPSYWFTSLSIPALVSGVGLGIRYYQYGLKLEAHDIWQQEQNDIDKNWQQWAMQSVSVLSSYIKLPHDLSTQQIFYDRANIPLYINQTLRFDHKIDYRDAFEDLLFAMRQALNKFDATVPLKITIYSSPEAYSNIDDDLYNAYQRFNFKQTYTLAHYNDTHVDLDLLTSLIDKSSPALHLLVANNLTSNKSAFLTGLLIADNEVFESVISEINAVKIVRPMESEDVVTGIEQMAEIQPAFQTATQLWFSHLDYEQESAIAVQLAKHNINIDDSYFLTGLAGEQTEMCYWLGLTYACQMATLSNQNNIVATTNNNKFLFSVVMSGNGGQYAE